ncbi:ABC transporter permease [Undibacterium oligocarboniphilum]|uniref:ABC transporter permease subunit n=1 Tax=Undibacterium oligocarboniphilum TaxID=666702 RepID=A0A850QLF5_9BURK|nr:ABC transporter permease subunit [Undibacterium oligocarboniphilum]MBC3870384.1 ABC transporter permease subunit [Undibacterium oligocarboniphilum]NVO78375.1 ABC transporter permease subunit [Undibacterium oligocarboniphilum]
MFELFKLQTGEEPREDTGPNRWDWALLPLILALLSVFAFAAMQMSRPFLVGEALQVSLDPFYLPYYLLRTILRMFTALGFSLLFSLIFAAVAVKYAAAEKVMIPALDILQSVPILGFQAIAIAPFIALFPGNLLGVECAAIFAIFTSQAWNMAFSLYQSMRNVPSELAEAAHIFRLSGWQRFWRLELPFAMPGLLWNMMMSMSGGWFFLVAAEAISVAGQDIKLPGIGSYIAVAIEAKNGPAIAWAIAAMLTGILLYDQLFFRPLLAWADKFRFEESQGETAQQSWLLDWMRNSRWVRGWTEKFWGRLGRVLGWFSVHHDGTSEKMRKKLVSPVWSRLWDVGLILITLLAIYRLMSFIHSDVGWHEAVHVVGLGFITLLRVMLLIGLASLVWVPIAVWIGLRPQYSQKVQAVAQFLAAFPVNLMFPLVVFVMLALNLSPNIWLSPLMVFGTQWYILFNVVAGASTIPNELRLAADNLGLSGWLKWKRVYLPAIFPSFITGAITASGGSWNASIVAEYVTWGKTTLVADGLGSYIKQMTEAGDFHRIALGIGIMCIFVTLLNRFFWRKLYLLAEDHIR